MMPRVVTTAMFRGWNRLVTITKAYRDPTSGNITTGSVVAEMAYDGLGRRITKAVKHSADLTCTYHYFYDGQRVVETRNYYGFVLKQQTWGLQYIDELVEIRLNHDPVNASSTTYGEHAENVAERTYYALHDANYNVMGVVDQHGDLVERYEYTPYGQRTVYSHGWIHEDYNDDGSVNFTDLTQVATDMNAGATEPPMKRTELTGDGQVTFSDYTRLSSNYGDLLPAVNDPTVNLPTWISFRDRENQTGAGPIALCEFGHQGLMHDEEFDLVHNRARTLHPRFGRFMQRDPLGYVDGMSLYAIAAGNPLLYLDPNGTDVTKDAYQLGGVGHHPVVRVLFHQVFAHHEWYDGDIMTDEAATYFEHIYSGRTKPHHGNVTIDEITHPQYSNAVREEWCAFRDKHGITKDNKLKEPQAKAFFKKITEGPFDSERMKLIKRFNDGIQVRVKGSGTFGKGLEIAKKNTASLTRAKTAKKGSVAGKGVVGGLIAGLFAINNLQYAEVQADELQKDIRAYAMAINAGSSGQHIEVTCQMLAEELAASAGLNHWATVLAMRHFLEESARDAIQRGERIGESEE